MFLSGYKEIVIDLNNKNCKFNENGRKILLK